MPILRRAEETLAASKQELLPSRGRMAYTISTSALVVPVVMEFNKSIVDYPSIKRVPGGASNDWRPDLQRPDNPVPLLDMKRPPRVKGMGG